MAENKLPDTVDTYLARGCGRCSLYDTPKCKVHTWQAELTALRNIARDCGLTEEIKWGVPCYTSGGKNIVLLHAFKEYCAINFVKGALLSDQHNLLTASTENSQSARQIRFTDVQQVLDQSDHIKAYIQEAMDLERSGAKIAFKPTAAFTMPEELQAMFSKMPELKTAFSALTEGRQRGYLLHFAAPKQAKTRQSRIEKCIPQILNGKGLYD